jgi:hypothetical protein
MFLALLGRASNARFSIRGEPQASIRLAERAWQARQQIQQQILSQFPAHLQVVCLEFAHNFG